MGKNTLATVFKLIRYGALVGGGYQSYVDGGQGGKGLLYALLGYGGIGTDNQFHSHVLARHWVPYLVACATTHGIPKLVGIIRKL